MNTNNCTLLNIFETHRSWLTLHPMGWISYMVGVNQNDTSWAVMSTTQWAGCFLECIRFFLSPQQAFHAPPPRMNTQNEQHQVPSLWKSMITHMINDNQITLSRITKTHMKAYTLPKFWWYNKVNLNKILQYHFQGFWCQIHFSLSILFLLENGKHVAAWSKCYLHSQKECLF